LDILSDRRRVTNFEYSNLPGTQKVKNPEERNKRLPEKVNINVRGGGGGWLKEGAPY